MTTRVLGIDPGLNTTGYGVLEVPIDEGSGSPTRISRRTPAAGDGISASTLSVEISERGASRSTVSPMFFSHFVTVFSLFGYATPVCWLGMIVLLVFGGAKLPKLARSLGQAQKEFKDGLAEGSADDADDA